MTEAEQGSKAVAFLGLGAMGLPMASRLLEAGFAVRGFDTSEAAGTAFAAAGGEAAPSAAQAAEGMPVLVTMLPDGHAVRDALLRSGAGAASRLRPGAIVVDMSSSAPFGTRDLAGELAERGLTLVDAPVSGGVSRARDGTLAIMVGGEEAAIERVRPLLQAIGRTVTTVGGPGAGHAAKALNNFVSACGLVAACEAALAAERFGIDPRTLVDVLNASTGRNNSTENKMKPHVLSGGFASGFALALMAKDLRIAAELVEAMGLGFEGPRRMAGLWTQASAALGSKADHTEIHRFLAGTAEPAGSPSGG